MNSHKQKNKQKTPKHKTKIRENIKKMAQVELKVL